MLISSSPHSYWTVVNVHVDKVDIVMHIFRGIKNTYCSLKDIDNRQDNSDEGVLGIIGSMCCLVGSPVWGE